MTAQEELLGPDIAPKEKEFQTTPVEQPRRRL
jgi:hypothetical protein